MNPGSYEERNEEVAFQIKHKNGDVSPSFLRVSLCDFLVFRSHEKAAEAGLPSYSAAPHKNKFMAGQSGEIIRQIRAREMKLFQPSS